MIKRNSRRKRLQFDMLEQRETPSAGLGGALAELATAHPAIVRARRHTGPISGSGTATLASAVPISGGFAVTGLIQGTVNGSPMTGTLQGVVKTATIRGKTTNTGTAGTATFVVNGSDLNISFVTSKTRKTFTVTGGTGVYAGATGHGQLNATVSAASETLTFNFHGTITTPG